MLDYRVSTFLMVCETMNYTRAAEVLNVTQPAVSQHIAYLERYYGVPLFTYEGKRLQLTEHGEFLRKSLGGMAHDERMLRGRLASLGASADLCLRVGMTLTAGEYVVGDPLARYLAEFPQVRCDVRSGDTATLLRLLDAGEIDCAFVEGFFDKSEYAWDIFCTEPFACVCATDDPLAKGTHVLEDLLGCSLLVREKGSGTRAVLEHALAARNLSVEGFARVSEVESLGVVKLMVQRSLGISFMYEAAVRRELEQGTLAKVALAGAPIEHDIAFLRLPGSVFEREFEGLFDGCRKMRSCDVC